MWPPEGAVPVRYRQACTRGWRRAGTGTGRRSAGCGRPGGAGTMSSPRCGCRRYGRGGGLVRVASGAAGCRPARRRAGRRSWPAVADGESGCRSRGPGCRCMRRGRRCCGCGCAQSRWRAVAGGGGWRRGAGGVGGVAGAAAGGGGAAGRGGGGLRDALFAVEWVPVPVAGGDSVAADRWAVIGAGHPGLAAAGADARVYADLSALAAAVDAGEPRAGPGAGLGRGGGRGSRSCGAGRRWRVVLGLVQEWLADERLASSRLVVVTRGRWQPSPARVWRIWPGRRCGAWCGRRSRRTRAGWCWPTCAAAGDGR